MNKSRRNERREPPCVITSTQLRVHSQLNSWAFLSYPPISHSSFSSLGVPQKPFGFFFIVSVACLPLRCFAYEIAKSCH